MKVEKQINVQPGRWGNECRMFGKRLRCKSKPRFMVFGEDGKPKLSRLECSVCPKHLVRAVMELKRRQINGTDVATTQSLA